jgi:CubicO group peptidase (beta-lactamase class C family)
LPLPVNYSNQRTRQIFDQKIVLCGAAIFNYYFHINYKLPVMTCLFKPSIWIAFFCLLNFSLFGQTKFFPHSTPEAEGVSAAGIDSFLTAAGQSKNEFHSFMMLRHGNVVAEGWWNPYRPDLKHTLYSTSKSFTSTAVGFAVSEHLLSVNDKVISFFPKSLPDTVKPYLAELTVKDLLMMSAGMEPDPTTVIPFKSVDWVKAFLATPMVHEPGTKFLYNTMATFTLSAIVQKVTGQNELAYLKPRLFEPLGISGEDWETSELGINTGGWGLRLHTEDMAKLGQLYLQKGMWKGKQLLPAAWINEATTFKIDQAPGATQSKRDSSDWMQGYCYQFWRCRHNAFRADGAFGQYIIVMPDKDAVIAITCETPDMQGEINLVWQYLLPAIKADALTANDEADITLNAHLASLQLPPLAKVAGGTVPSKTFTFKPNALLFKSIAFKQTGGICRVTLQKDSATYQLAFATGKWMPGETNLDGPSLLAGDKEDISFLRPYKVDGSYTWLDKNTLELKLRYIESPHSEIITCKFDNGQLTATVVPSFNYGAHKVELQGE